MAQQNIYKNVIKVHFFYIYIPRPLKNHKNIGFLSKIGPDPLNNHKATKPAFNIGPSLVRQRNAFSGIWIPSSTKKIVKVGPL